MSLCDSTEKDSYNAWQESLKKKINGGKKRSRKKSYLKQKVKVVKPSISNFLKVFENFLLLKAPSAHTSRINLCFSQPYPPSKTRPLIYLLFQI